MGSAGAPLPTSDSHDLAAMFDPVLHAAAQGRLGEIDWFTSHHQRGGAATGFSTWRLGDDAATSADQQIPVLVKFPVGPVELEWTAGLGAAGPEHWSERWALTLPTPRVLASGVTLGGYDLAWIITERLEPGPTHLDASSFEDMLRVTADFQAAAMKHAPLRPAPPPPNWEHAIERSRELARAGSIADHHRWTDALKRVHKVLPILRRRWESRPVNAWCHGDVHPGNVLRRPLPADSPDPDLVNRHGCVLIDLALVHAGHWAEDALYLERQCWAHSGLVALKPVSLLARLRRERGLPADDNYGETSMVRRVLMASCAPALLDREGSPRHIAAALSIIERHLPQVSK